MLHKFIRERKLEGETERRRRGYDMFTGWMIEMSCEQLKRTEQDR